MKERVKLHRHCRRACRRRQEEKAGERCRQPPSASTHKSRSVAMTLLVSLDMSVPPLA